MRWVRTVIKPVLAVMRRLRAVIGRIMLKILAAVLVDVLTGPINA